MGQIELISELFKIIDADVSAMCISANTGKLVFFEKGPRFSTFSSLNIDKRPGIYIFKANRCFSLDKSRFNSVPCASKTNKNLIANQISSGSIVYIGKSETSVAKRIDQHIKKCGSSVYSLRLFNSARAQLIKSLFLDVYYLKQEYSKNYAKFLLTEVEQRLFDVLKPIIGSRRNG